MLLRQMLVMFPVNGGLKEIRALHGILKMLVAHPTKWAILLILLKQAKQQVDDLCPCL